MELFLNLIWLAVSVALGTLLILQRRRSGAAPQRGVYKSCSFADCASRSSTVWLAYLVLIALILPAISMTDDLLAMTVSSDGEQIARRYDCSPGVRQQLDLHVAVIHAVPDVSSTPLLCTGIVETESSPRISHPILTECLRDRAPPTSG